MDCLTEFNNRRVSSGGMYHVSPRCDRLTRYF